MEPFQKNDRFDVEDGLRILVQVPAQHCQTIIDAVRTVDSLKYGDYDSVSFQTSAGIQQFKALGGGRNSATEGVVAVACVELSFFVPDSKENSIEVLKQIYSAHPYEEPVVFIQPCTRTLHIRGLDEDNPNRFWNRPTKDWVPKEHQ